MADSPRYPGIPRWVKVFGIIGLVVVLLVIILLFTRGPGGHGPGRHLSSGEAAALTIAGPESRGYPAHDVSVAVAEKLGRDGIELPGGHIGFLSKPAEFAREFIQVLARTG